ncbi:alpha/beta hydrolase [Flavisphingomonas formosensis]|uniref:alpha/beta hydrolase n=1 Tax=Flavisphingomonas formosensis TaxID=861534 RepID=UPI0018E044DF|nr:alpha/beta hydrolase [Sphingomonas formosensis]
MAIKGRSAHLVDRDLRDLLALWPEIDLNEASLLSARQVVAELVAGHKRRAVELAAFGVVMDSVTIPARGNAPAVRANLFRPAGGASAPRPAYFHIHGGGLIMGSPDFEVERDARMVQAHDCIVLSPQYRLAPEHHFPDAIEDLYAAYCWLVAEAEALGIDRERVAVGGESAGGGLAAALSLLIRDRGAPAAAGHVLIYPMLDDRTGATVEPSPYAGEFMWTAAMNRFAWGCYLNRSPGAEGVSPHAAAARAEVLSGLPPTYIFTGALDLFLDENLDFAKRLIRDGVRAGIRVYPGAFHGFDLVAESAAALAFGRDVQETFHMLFAERTVIAPSASQEPGA